MTTKLITSAEAAKLLGYDRASITRMANSGTLKGQKIGDGRTSSWVFTPQAVRAAKKRLEKRDAS